MPSRQPIALLVFPIAILAQTVVAGADDLETLRSRLMAPLLAAPDAGFVTELIDTMQDDGTWADIDYASKSRSSWPLPTHLSRLASIARAYRAPGSLQGDAKVLAAAQKALDAWLRLDPKNPNWWWNQIGVPKSLLPTLLLLDGQLTEQQRADGLKILRRAKISMTGQNLVWVTEITAGRGVLEHDAELVTKAYQRIAKEIRIDLSEGIQPDYSFHQHGPCLYSHGYGAGFITDCSRIAANLDGTSMAFPQEKIDLLTHLVLDGTQWMTRGSATDFGAEGREITRKGQSTSHLLSAASSLLKLKTGRKEELRQLIARASDKEDAPPLVGNRHFWRADMMTHHRPDYYASARMHSRRLANTDGPANSEGLLSHHLADGCFVLMQTGKEYHDIFGVWDWQKIPGTTVQLKSKLTGSPRRMGSTDFVGGVSDGMYGLAACDWERGKLTAKKSWFFFDDCVVCLGAGITAESDADVITTLNQCYLAGDVLLADTRGSSLLSPGKHASESAKCLWHDSVGYVFLEPGDLHVENETKSSSWHVSNRRYPDQAESAELFTAWLDHGVSPQGSSYAYVVVPGTSGNEIAEYASHLSVQVLANREDVQAVRHPALDLTAAAFYVPGEVEIRPGLTLAVDKPCLLLTQEKGNSLHVTVSNPQNRGLEVELEVLGRGEAGRPNSYHISLPGEKDAGSSVSAIVPIPDA